MKIISQKREGNKVSFEIEEGYERFQKSFEAAMASAGKELRIAGFRPGKAPRNILEKALNQEAVAHHAAQDLIAELYPEIIEAGKIDPVDYPNLEIVQPATKDKPFLFKLNVEVYPEIKLGKYKGLKLAKKPSEVTEEEVLAALGRLQERFSSVNAEGEKELTPLDDEFAKKVSRYGTLAELKAEVQQAMASEKMAEVDADLKNQAIAAAGADTKVDIPAAMTAREVDIMLDELKTSLARSGLTLEDYLRGAKKEEAALREEMKKSAEIRVKGKVILKAVAEAEKMQVTAEEISAEVKAMGAAEEKIGPEVKKYVEEYLLRKKALDLLIEKASVKFLDVARNKEEKKQ
jgi:trigger factor